MRSFHHVLFPFYVFFLIQSCDNPGDIDRAAVAEEMAAREIKKVSSNELLSRGLKYGDQIAFTLDEALRSSIEQATGFDEQSLKRCVINEWTEFHELDSQNIAVIRVSNKIRNPQNEPDSLEKLILEAYEYAEDKHLDLSPTIQEISSSTILYTKPIFAKGKCMSCHGEIGKVISENQYLDILSRYPKDSSVGFGENKFMGMWAVRIPKKVIVNDL